MGMTPVKTYDPDREIPILVEAGDYIRFVPIDEDEYKRIRELENVANTSAPFMRRHKMGIRILKGGMMTTVQDLGRYGYQSQGFSVAGVMDVRSFKIANLLLDNPRMRQYWR